ncbi:hypothetical protein GH714_000713 [Hevea brasiliensis]|uniref:Reverse transcriptase domain-containing protein n=1 Tax=Hevea brasiliensis TaxID=3981 RepID=A0A6A6LAI7_HEVBR|nr:hypothetical protein GH714_000713 [Hevea brasiliensis]
MLCQASNLKYSTLSPAEALRIEEPFSYDEVKAVVWACDSSKAIGPDGANFCFYKNSWDLIKDDVVALVNDFYSSSSLPPIKLSFLSLVPKFSGSSKVHDYRSISLIHGLYKIIAMLLANRIKGLLPSVISPQQNAFVKGRQILDSFLVASEIVGYHKKANKSCFLFKIDFEIAFDMVSWDHIERGVGAIGGMLHDSCGVFVCLLSCRAGIVDSNTAELMAIHKAIELCFSLPTICFSALKIYIESYSKFALSWVKHPESAPWHLSSVINSMYKNIKALPPVVLHHTLGEGNPAADSLAKHGLSKLEDLVAFM